MTIKTHVKTGSSVSVEQWEAIEQCGVLVRLGMGWFGGLITRQSQRRTSHIYDYRVILEKDQLTRSMKLPLEKYSGDPEAVVRSWVLLEACTAGKVLLL
ncbi:unnamed protein product [Ectocarpus sp. 12 AP-2014]